MAARSHIQTMKRAPLSLKAQALALLARREHSRAELVRKLAAEGSAEEIDMVLSQLEQRGLLSDARCAEAYVRAHAAKAGEIGRAHV